MRIKVIHPKKLTPEHVYIWSRIQQADSAVDSPYFCPEFTKAVAAVRDNVEVAMLQEDGEPVGFFPFQRHHLNVGIPVGGKLSDFDGIIARRGLQWTADELTHACRLTTWRFDHLVASQQPFQPYHYKVEESPYLDLSLGFDAYVEERRKSGSKLITQVQRKSRKIEREIGPIRFEFHSSDNKLFNALLVWKSEQHKLTKVVDICRIRWVVELLKRIRDTQTEEFAGVFSVLYAAKLPIAVHLGMRTNEVMHLWFPTYDRNYSKYSPGLILLLKISEAISSMGIKRFDPFRCHPPNSA